MQQLMPFDTGEFFRRLGYVSADLKQPQLARAPQWAAWAHYIVDAGEVNGRPCAIGPDSRQI